MNFTKEQKDLALKAINKSQLLSAGYSASQLLSAGYSASELLSAGYSASEVLSAGYSASEVLSAGYSASELLSAGYSASQLLSAGYSASQLLSAGYSASEVLSAGYSASEVLSAGYSKKDLAEWDAIPVLEMPYSVMLSEIKEGKRILKQSTFGDKLTCHICGTPMCIGGNLVQMAIVKGYKFKGDYVNESALIALKAHPDYPFHDFSKTEDEPAFALLEQLAAFEQTGLPFTLENFLAQ